MFDAIKGFFMQKYPRRIAISGASAIAILLLNYLAGNWIGFLFDDSPMLSIVNSILPERDFSDEDVIYFNVGLDKELVAIRDEAGDSIGSAVITNRNTLLTFLNLAAQADYKYIFMDIRFEKYFNTPTDKQLFDKIASMPRIVISTHSEMELSEIADSALVAKTAYADFLSTFFSGFSKYAYRQYDKESVALRMYRELDRGNIARIGPFFFSGLRLCNNQQFLTFSQDDVVDSESILSKYPAFGGEILTLLTTEEIVAQMNDKIVVVGDMQSDVHGTYAGEVPGPILNVRAYHDLHNGLHKVNFVLVLILLVIYSLISYFILFRRHESKPTYVRRFMIRYPLLSFLCLCLGWATVLFALSIIVFCIFRTSIIILIPSLFFSAMSMPRDFKDFRQNLKA